VGHSLRSVVGLGILAASLATVSCSGESSRSVSTTAPTATANPFTSMKVGVAGNVTTPLTPGETRQLWAVATAADGATTDVTNVAIWQSSDPSIATVSATGVVKAAIEGTINVSATYLKVTGSMEIGIEKEQPKPPIGCVATLDRPRLVYNAFGGTTSVTVTLTKSDCRWTVTADAAWLKLNSTPFVSGTGAFSYEVLDNNTPSPRDGHVTIRVTDGPTVVHDVTQEKPGCSYVVTPNRASFTSAGGTGSFEVVTTPADCQWIVVGYYSFYPVEPVGATSGTGRATVTYRVSPYSETYERNITLNVSGLSGANPPGPYTITLAPRR